jgi:two-component system NarL family sensor kinase
MVFTKRFIPLILFFLFSSSTIWSQAQVAPNQATQKLIDQAIENWYNDKFQLSLTQAKKALDQSIKQKNNDFIAESYNIIGVNFDDLVMADKALFYYTKGLQYAEKTNNLELKSKLNNNVANIYFFEKKKYNLGLNYYTKSLNHSIKAKDSVKIYLRKLNMTWAYFEINEFKKGKTFLDYINSYRRFGDESTIVALNMLNGDYFANTNNPEKANFYFTEAIKAGKKGNEKFDLSITYQKYSNFLAKEKDYKGAYENLSIFNTLSDEILQGEKATKAKITGLNLELNEYLREIKKIESEYKSKHALLIKESLSSQKRYFSLIILFCICVILFYFYLQNMRLIQKNRYNNLRNKIQQNLINATVSGQEMERKKIASFLHDNISAILSAAGLHLKVFDSKSESKNEEITKTISLLADAHAKVRDLSHELIPVLLVRFGLFYALEDLTEKNSNSTLQFKYESTIDTQTRYSEEFEMKIYFIVTELLNNIMKHSNASISKISIEENNNYLKIEVFDNGKGFDTLKFNVIEGFGLNQISARINAMNGYFHITSKLDMGTVIDVEVPIVNS